MRKLTKFIAVGAIACSALAMTAFASDGAIGSGTVNTTSGLRLRGEASTSAAVVSVMPSGAQVSVLSDAGGWYQVSYEGKTGYCSAEYIDFSETLNIKTGTVIATVLNMRSAPSTGSSVITKLSGGAALTILDESDGWYFVKTEAGVEGYVFAEYVHIRGGGGAAVKEAGELVDFALGHVGCAYSYGGTGPDSFDCSGFAQYIYTQRGYNIPRTAGDQMKTGTAVEKADLLPGDLVFFSESASGYITHVGIYIGDGEIVHANTPSTGVIVSDLGSDYYERYYAGACRLIF